MNTVVLYTVNLQFIQQPVCLSPLCAPASLGPTRKSTSALKLVALAVSACLPASTACLRSGVWALGMRDSRLRTTSNSSAETTRDSSDYEANEKSFSFRQKATAAARTSFALVAALAASLALSRRSHKQFKYTKHKEEEERREKEREKQKRQIHWSNIIKNQIQVFRDCDRDATSTGDGDGNGEGDDDGAEAGDDGDSCSS